MNTRTFERTPRPDDPTELTAPGEADPTPAMPSLVDALRALPLTCSYDRLNPCWGNRPADAPGQHWGGGKACPECRARAALQAQECAEAAPHMLAALRAIHDWLDQPVQHSGDDALSRAGSLNIIRSDCALARKIAADAIAKATGSGT